MHEEHAMNTPRHSTLRRLRSNQPVSFRRPRALCLRAERGTLWVTVDGRLDDIALEPGQRQIFDGPDTVVVSSFDGKAVFSVTPLAPPAAWPQRLARWLGMSAAPVAGWAR
jgi:hypothetical protein